MLTSKLVAFGNTSRRQAPLSRRALKRVGIGKMPVAVPASALTPALSRARERVCCRRDERPEGTTLVATAEYRSYLPMSAVEPGEGLGVRVYAEMVGLCEPVVNGTVRNYANQAAASDSPSSSSHAAGPPE